MIEIVSFSYLFVQDKEVQGSGFRIFDCRDFPDPQGKGIGFSGKEQAIQDYVFQNNEAAAEFLATALDALDETNKIAFGCVGGKNRSVAFAEKFYQTLSNNSLEARLEHLALPHWE